MSNRSSRARRTSTRSRKQRLAAGAVLASTALLGTYLSALRAQPTYASPSGGGTTQEPDFAAKFGVGPASNLTCTESVSTERALSEAAEDADPGDVICVLNDITLETESPRIDTTVTIVGANPDGSTPTITDARPEGGPGFGNGIFRAFLDDDGEGTTPHTFTLSNLILTNGYLYAHDEFSGGGAVAVAGSTDDKLILNNVTITDSSAKRLRTSDNTSVPAYGGGLWSEVTTEISHSTLSNNTGASGGAVYVNGDITITNSTFGNNVASGWNFQVGGAVWVRNGDATIAGSTFTGNYSVSRGGAVNTYGDATIIDSSFINNSSSSSGGAASIGGVATIGDSSFTDNAADDQGGALYVFSSSSISGSTFIGNTAGGRGGAVYAEAGIAISDGTFAGNEAGSSGGAVFNYSDEALISDSKFEKNKAVENGGAIYIYYAGEIKDSSFAGNSADGSGGAVYILDYGEESSSITKSDFEENMADGDGGAVYLNGEATITDSTFTSNTAKGDGGAIYVDGGGDITVTTSAFTSNTAQNGGAIYISARTVITRSTFELNQSLNSSRRGGGAIFIDDPTDISESYFYGNNAVYQGGAIYVNDIFELERSSFIANSASKGGAIYTDNDAVISNTFMSRNSATDTAGSIYVHDSGSLQLFFSTLYDDTAAGVGRAQSVFVYAPPTSLFEIKGSVIGSSTSNDTMVGSAGAPIVNEHLILTGPEPAAFWTKGQGSQVVDPGEVGLGAEDAQTDKPWTKGRPPVDGSILFTAAAPDDLDTDVTVDQLGVERTGLFTIGARQGAGSPGPGPDPDPTPPAPVPPSAPGGLVATPGNGSVTLSWSAPSTSGSFPVTSYQAVLNPGGQSCLVTTTTCTISGLTNGTSYTAQVRALTGAGWGPYSSASAPFTPAVNPQPTPPAPQPIPAPLPAGQSSASENGQPITIAVDPNATNAGLVISGDGFEMQLDGLDAQGRPLNLGPDGVLVLREEREVQTSGSGFAPGSAVGLYMDPPVQTSAASVRPANTGVLLGTLVVDDKGEFGGTVTLPSDIAAGEHVVQAVGLAGTGALRVLNLGVLVEPDRSIMISGTRAEVRGRNGVSVNGATTGLVGAKAEPRVKLPGQTRYARGKGVRTINASGAFTWQRITGKKVYVYFVADGVRSNRIVLTR